MQEESVSLYYQDAGSNKEYHAQLQAKDGGFVVAFQYGPRGGTLTSGFKTKEPVDYAVAKKAYDKLVKEKMGKGYSPGEAGSSFVGTSMEERFTGIVPQLLNAITEEQAQALLDDPEWVVQEKKDGHRRLAQRLVENAAAQTLGINRKGLVTGLPAGVARELGLLQGTGTFVVDGELVGDQYFLFDVLEYDGVSVREKPLSERLVLLSKVESSLAARCTAAHVSVLYTAYTAEDKRRLYEEVHRAGEEGLVFKRLSSAYVPGRPNSGGNQLKRKFTESASVIVASRNPTKRSVGMELLNANFEKVNVGNVTIPANYDIPVVGAVVEVEYLYAFEGGSLFQPQYRGVRDDLEAAAACVLSQLRYKPAGTSEGGEDSDDN